MKILLAEDDSSIRRYIEIILQREGYVVLSAEDGLDAIKLLLATDFDVIVADAMMPNLSGYDVLRFVRQNPGYESIPFIILSGMAKDELAESGIEPDSYITKGDDLKNSLIAELTKLLSLTAVP